MGRDEWITGGMTRVSVTAGVLFHSSLPSPPHPFHIPHSPRSFAVHLVVILPPILTA